MDLEKKIIEDSGEEIDLKNWLQHLLAEINSKIEKTSDEVKRWELLKLRWDVDLLNAEILDWLESWEYERCLQKYAEILDSLEDLERKEKKDLSKDTTLNLSNLRHSIGRWWENLDIPEWEYEQLAKIWRQASETNIKDDLRWLSNNLSTSKNPLAKGLKWIIDKALSA